ncbi:hypothetical protein [Dinoroseobacter sp. S375]|uniref:hypothetical protein n=1 Tax=Dinoroseobacter sp. S375 TaxID=3415136 RepID=UPI003C7B50CB
MIEPTSGAVPINAAKVGNMGPEALREIRADKIGMVCRNMALVPQRTVRDDAGSSLELNSLDGITVFLRVMLNAISAEFVGPPWMIAMGVLTDLGVQQAPKNTKEAALRFGANPRQFLTKVERPLAMPSIMAGINQLVMTSHPMVGIAALIGARATGYVTKAVIDGPRVRSGDRRRPVGRQCPCHGHILRFHRLSGTPAQPFHWATSPAVDGALEEPL